VVVELLGFSSNIEELASCTSSDKKVDSVVEVVDFLEDQRLDLFTFVEVLLLLGDLFVDYICETGTGVWVEGGGGIGVRVQIVVSVDTGTRALVRCNAKIVPIIIFNVTGIVKII
jgi:hypothetical protein